MLIVKRYENDRILKRNGDSMKKLTGTFSQFGLEYFLLR